MSTLLNATLVVSTTDSLDNTPSIVDGSVPEDIYIGQAGIQNRDDRVLTVLHEFPHYYGITGLCTDSPVPFTIEHTVNGTDWFTVEGSFTGTDQYQTQIFTTPFVAQSVRVQWMDTLQSPIHLQFKGCAPTENQSLFNTLEHLCDIQHRCA